MYLNYQYSEYHNSTSGYLSSLFYVPYYILLSNDYQVNDMIISLLIMILIINRRIVLSTNSSNILYILSIIAFILTSFNIINDDLQNKDQTSYHLLIMIN